MGGGSGTSEQLGMRPRCDLAENAVPQIPRALKSWNCWILNMFSRSDLLLNLDLSRPHAYEMHCAMHARRLGGGGGWTT